eukprot:6140982-Amphidinium_carterae.1
MNPFRGYGKGNGNSRQHCPSNLLNCHVTELWKSMWPFSYNPPQEGTATQDRMQDLQFCKRSHQYCGQALFISVFQDHRMIG